MKQRKWDWICQVRLWQKMYDRLAEAGYESDGTQALIKLWWQDGKNLKMTK